VSRFPPFAARQLHPQDRAAAIALAAAGGVHGLYVHNALHGGEGEVLALHGLEQLLGIAWFGPRGNLILLQQLPLDPLEVATAVQRSAMPWRIALGPAPLVIALAALVAGQPLVHREQVYYAATPDEAPPALRSGSVRAPLRGDRERLMQATLQLNASDLRVDPARVDRRWLRNMVDGRIADGSSRVLGPVGQVVSKLDIGSTGPAGIMLEGVFTFPEARGQGLATTLVATVLAAASAPVVSLHVAADNLPARAAYERAGMTARTSCRLLLLS